MNLDEAFKKWADERGVWPALNHMEIFTAGFNAAQQDADKADAQPVAWFAFADNNGPVALELYGWDEKACKHAVLFYARADNWKGTVEGYLLRNGWTLRPVYLAETQPDPAMEGDDLPWPWRVALFWASSSPGTQVRVLVDGYADIERMAKHPSFIKWVSVQPASAGDAKDAERYRAIRAAAVADDHSFLDQLEDYAEKCFPDGHPPVEADLDACIDAVIQQRAGK